MSIFTDDSMKYLRFFVGELEITDHVIFDSWDIADYLCTQELNFGETNCGKLKFKMDLDLQLTGQKIRLEYGADNEWEVLGTYKVTYTSHEVNSDVVSITAYDALKEFDKNVADWFSSLPFPITLKRFREAIFEHFGIVSPETSLINDDLMVYETVAPSTFNALDILFYIGQINGVFAHATSDYSVEWVSLGEEAYEITSDLLNNYDSFEGKSYETAPIGGLIIREQSGDIGVSIGTTNRYVVEGNVLVYGFSSEMLNVVATRLYDKIKTVSYTPCTIGMKHIPELKMGSKCSYGGKSFYVMQRHSKGLLFDVITSPGTMYIKDTPRLENQLEQLRGKSNVLEFTIEKTRSEIDNVAQGLHSEITQLADSVEIQISDIYNEIDGAVNLYNVTEQPTLKNYPAWDFTYNIPCNNTVQTTEDLHFIYNDDYYRKNVRALAYNEKTAQTSRFVLKDDVWMWDDVADTDFGVLQQQITELKVDVEGVSSNVSAVYVEFDGVKKNVNTLSGSVTQTNSKIEAEVTRAKGEEEKLTSRLAISENSISSEVSRATTAEGNLDTRITQTAEEISSKVSKDSVVSEINQSAESVKIKAEKLELSGYATFSALSGSGKTNINGDNIKSGTIKGRTISGCAIVGGAASFGNNNVIANDGGFWVIGISEGHSHTNPAFAVDDRGQLSMWSVDGIQRLYTNGSTVVGRMVTGSDIYAATSNWFKICRAGEASVSDRRLKDDIVYIESDKELEDFYNSLKPVTFRYKKGASLPPDQTHIGFIAQDVEDSLKGSDKDYAVFEHYDLEKLGVDKQEIIALNTWQIQKLKAENAELKERLSRLESMLLKEEL